MMTENGEPQVLLIDDDVSILGSLVKIFSKQDFVTVAVNNFVEAKRFIDLFKFDVVVVDLIISNDEGAAEQQGFDFCRLLLDKYEVPVIILSAVDDPSTIEYAGRLSIDNYVVKPFDPNDLIRLILDKCRASKRRQIKQKRQNYLSRKTLLTKGEKKLVDFLANNKDKDNCVYLDALEDRLKILMSGDLARKVPELISLEKEECGGKVKVKVRVDI